MGNVGSITGVLCGGIEFTLIVALGSWVLATIVGLILASIVELKLPVLARLIFIVVSVVRSIPELLMLYLCYFGLSEIGLSLTPLTAAILAIGLGESAFTSEIFRASFLNIPRSQTEAGLSVGLRRTAVLRRVVLPQVVPFVLPPLVNSFSALLKVATLASAIGVDEVLERASIEMANTGVVVSTLTIVVVIYVILTVPLARVVGWLERRARRTVEA